MSAVLTRSDKLDRQLGDDRRRRVLLVPDSIHWVLGNIAKAIATANPIESTIVSGPLLGDVFESGEEIAARFDLVHFLCPYTSREWLPRLRGKVPVVTSHHHVTSWDLISHNLEGDAIVAGSLEWVRDLEARGADLSRVFRVPYGVDVSRFVPASAEQRVDARRMLGLGNTAPVIGFFAKRASNDDDRKGTNVFIDGMVLLRKKLPNLGALIVGPGWHDLAAKFRENGIRTTWIPFVEDVSNLPRLYRAVDFYWVTSRVEGGPVPLLEAMSSGICCLSTRVGLAQEVVSSGVNALLLPMDDSAAFANATVELWADRSSMESMGMNARQTMVDQMRSDDVAKLVQPAYTRATDNFRARNPSVQLRTPGATDRMTAAETRRLETLEDLAWAENLVMYHNQRGAALKLIAKAWNRDRRSLRPLRVFLRRFLPEPLTRRVVTLKQKIAGIDP